MAHDSKGLRSKVCVMAGRKESPSIGVIDSRSVKTSHHVDSDRGLDGNKKIKGRKQHIIVDTQGNLMAIAVHEANVHDSKGAPKVIENLSFKFPRLAKILADGGYRGNLADWLLDKFGWELEVVLRPDECPSKFKVLPKRWIVERSFAWLENFRRLTIDYEYHADTAETMVQLAFCKIMLNKFVSSSNSDNSLEPFSNKTALSSRVLEIRIYSRGHRKQKQSKNKTVLQHLSIGCRTVFSLIVSI